MMVIMGDEQTTDDWAIFELLKLSRGGIPLSAEQAARARLVMFKDQRDHLIIIEGGDGHLERSDESETVWSRAKASMPWLDDILAIKLEGESKQVTVQLMGSIRSICVGEPFFTEEHGPVNYGEVMTTPPVEDA